MSEHQRRALAALHRACSAVLERADDADDAAEAQRAIAGYDQSCGEGAFLALAHAEVRADVRATVLWALASGKSRGEVLAMMLAELSRGRPN